MTNISLTAEQEKNLQYLTEVHGGTPDEIVSVALDFLRKQYEDKLCDLRAMLEKSEQSGGSSTIEEYKAGFAQRRATYIEEHGFNA